MINKKRKLNLTFIVASFLIMAAIFSQPIDSVFAHEENEDNPRLNFVSHIDECLYSERLVDEVFQSLGYDITITQLENDKGLESVNSGIYCGISSQAEGDFSEYKDMVKIPIEISKENYYAVVNDHDKTIYSSWADLEGKSVGVLNGRETIKDELPDNIKEYISEPNMTQLYGALRQNKTDVIIFSDSSGRSAGEIVLPGDLKIAGHLGSKPCHIYLNKTHASLVDDAVKKINAMKEDGSLERLKDMKPVSNRKEKVVLYLSSYSSEMLWEQKILNGVGNVLDQHTNIIYHNIAINSYRNMDNPSLEEQVLSTISSDFIHSPPDAVIVSDNEAMHFLVNNYNSLLSNDIPVVFCGVNNKTLLTPELMKRCKNMGGILETISASDTVNQMLKEFPDTESIFVINDYSLTGSRWKSSIQNQLEKYSDKVEIIYNENVTYRELMEQVSSLDKNSLILCGSYFLDSKNNYYPQATFQDVLAETSPVPIFGLLDTTQGMGQVGGKYADAKLHGETAAQIVIGALKENDTDNIEVKDMELDNRWVFDIHMMKHYGIKKSDLPSGSTVLNSEPSLSESNPVLFYSIIAGAAVLLVIIILLSIFAYILNKRNKKLVTAEEHIRNSRNEINTVRNRLETIIETAPIAYSLLVDDVVVESNRYYKEHIGAIDGQKNVDKYGTGERYKNLMDKCMEEGAVEDIYWRLEKDGKPGPRYIYNIGRTEYKGKDAIVMWGVEIEELERQKDALTRAYKDLQQIIESVPLPISLVMPSKKKYLFVNKAWFSLFDAPEDFDISTVKLGSLTKGDLDSMINKALKEDKIVSGELTFRTIHGDEFVAQTSYKRVIYDNEECLVIALKDLREEKARENMLKNAAHKEKEANRLKSHFLMNVSHEIRTPMNSIIGMTQVVKHDDDPQKLFTSITQIGKSASVLLNIINSVLDMSLIEEGKMVLKPEICSLTDIIDNVNAVIDVEIDNKDLIKKVNIDGIDHDMVITDPSRLEQVLIALLTNAIKFTSEGGKISLTVEESEKDEDTLTYLFKVRDNGIGIEQEKMDRLFKSFEQVDDSLTREYGGMGLGLSISRDIVKLLGGEIWVESEVGIGSEFCFTIQVPRTFESNDDDSVTEEDASKETEIEDQSDFSNVRVLIVDDVEINRMIIEELLAEIGVQTEEAENGKEALDKFTSSEPGYYDMILMDVQMPVMDGCSATREIRKLNRPDAKDLPILAVTANALPDDVKMVMECGMQDILEKPVFKEQLIQLIKRLYLGTE